MTDPRATMLCRVCDDRVAVHGNYCRECLDRETQSLSNEEQQAAEIIYASLGHRLTREQVEAKFAEARARLERESNQ